MSSAASGPLSAAYGPIAAALGPRGVGLGPEVYEQIMKVITEDIVDDIIREETALIAAATYAALLYMQIRARSKAKKAKASAARARLRARQKLATARDYCDWLLDAPETTFIPWFRMKKAVFRELCQWLRVNTAVSESRQQSLEQKVMVFLWIVIHNESYKIIAQRFYMSQDAVSQIFRDLIEPMRQLHAKFVRPPEASHLSPLVELRSRYMQFNGAIGVIAGLCIPTTASCDGERGAQSSAEDRAESQKVLAAVNFEGHFTFVFAGAEGTFSYESILEAALTKKIKKPLKIPEGRYFLADAGFNSRKGLLLPFAEARYHFKDREEAHAEPATKEEEYNKRHAELCNIADTAFASLRKKFKIIRQSATGYNLLDQVRIVFAVTGLYNFIEMEGCEPTEEDRLRKLEKLSEDRQEGLSRGAERADGIIPERSGSEMRELVCRWISEKPGTDD